MVAAGGEVSSGAKPHKTALSGLYERPVEGLPRQVEVAHHLAVHLDAALGDQPARFARRADPEMLDEESRQMHGPVTRQSCFRNLVRSPALTDDAREVVLRLLRGPLPVRAADDEARELELRLHRIAGE